MSSSIASPRETLDQKRNQYAPAFHLLVQDFLRVCEFIEPVDAHLHVFSHRLYELLLRASTEFESLSREILEAHGLGRPGNLNITDFVAIAPILELQRQNAIASFWRPVAATLSPFKHWTPAAVGLPWYQGYNAVKHNRNAEFSRATLENVRDAICSVFIILARLEFLESIGSRMDAPGGTWQGIDRFRDIPFALHYELVLPGSFKA
jgi:hypothetical protein